MRDCSAPKACFNPAAWLQPAGSASGATHVLRLMYLDDRKCGIRVRNPFGAQHCAQASSRPQVPTRACVPHVTIAVTAKAATHPGCPVNHRTPPPPQIIGLMLTHKYTQRPDTNALLRNPIILGKVRAWCASSGMVCGPGVRPLAWCAALVCVLWHGVLPDGRAPRQGRWFGVSVCVCVCVLHTTQCVSLGVCEGVQPTDAVPAMHGTPTQARTGGAEAGGAGSKEQKKRKPCVHRCLLHAGLVGGAGPASTPPARACMSACTHTHTHT